MAASVSSVLHEDDDDDDDEDKKEKNKDNENDDDEDFPQDFEPGRSRNSMLVTTSSYEEIEEELESEASYVHLHDGGSSGGDGGSANTNGGERRTTTTTTTTMSEIEEEEEESVVDGDENVKTQNTTALKDLSASLDDDDVDDVDDLSESLSQNIALEDVEGTDETHCVEWRQHKKHIFILSEAGKPIYSRYGKEDKLVTLMGVMQALMSFVQDSNDSLRCIIAGGHKFVFLNRTPIILVAVSEGQESVAQLMMQLNYLYNQILNLLTYTQLSQIFERRRNYDLRRLLTGAEKFLDNMLLLMDHEPSFLLGAVRCLPLQSSVRDAISQAIVSSCGKLKNLVFAILVANNQLITLVRLKKYFIHPVDLHVIFNLVNASESLKTGESWMPICLPKFDSSGFLHGHVSYLDEDCPACLLLLTVDREAFFQLSECKRKIVEKLNRHNYLKTITDSVFSETYKVGDVGIADLRHFMYKSRSTAQYTSPELEAPYTTSEERERIFGLYLYLHQRIHNASRPLKILFHAGEKETMLGWVTSGFELYTTFEPLVNKFVAINAVNKLLRWIKKEEDKLFILSSAVF